MNTAIGTALAADSDGFVGAERAAVSALADLPGERVDFCQVFCAVEYDYESVVSGVRSVVGPDASLVGCSAVNAFTGSSADGGGGTIAVGLVASDSVRFFTGLGRNLSDNVSRAVRDAVEPLPATVDGYPYRAAITLHDGIASVGEELALVAQQKLGPEVNIVGGAAGDDHNLRATHVFHDDVVTEDGVVLALIAAEERPAIAVEHGHEPLSTPFEVTSADGSLVHELDGEPAFDVWKDAVREPVRETFGVVVDDLDRDDQLLQRILCAFEFGIDQGDRHKMRWPWVEVDDDGGTMHFAVDVPEGTVVRVMHGDEGDQIESARSAARRARVHAGETDVAGAFVYDCACRGIVLGDEFSTAVDAMADELDLPLVGFETYGEMCTGVGQFSGFHNTTTVVLLLPS